MAQIVAGLVALALAFGGGWRTGVKLTMADWNAERATQAEAANEAQRQPS